MSAIGPALLALVQDLLAASETGAADVLSAFQSIGDDVAKRQEQAQRLIDEATNAAKQIQQQEDALLATAEGALAQIESAANPLQGALQRAQQEGAQAVAALTRQFDQREAAARAANRAQAELDQLAQERNEAIAKAQQAAQDAVVGAQAQLDAARTQAQQAVDQARAEAEAAKADVERRVASAAADIAAKVQELTDQAAAIAGLAGLPPNAAALADDARAELAKLMGADTSLLGLLTRALVALKAAYFGDLDELQVATYDPGGGHKHGIGLSWVDPNVKLLAAYTPDHPTPTGGLTLQAIGGAGGPVTVAAGPATVTVSGAGEQATVVSFQNGAAPAGNADVTVSATLPARSGSLAGLTTLSSGTPSVTIRLRTDGGQWRYRVAAKVDQANIATNLGALLGPVAAVVSLPDLAIGRTFELSLEDGVASFAEQATP